MSDDLKSNIRICEDVYDTRLGKGNWALTNYGGVTKVVVRNKEGYHYGFCQLKQTMVDDINKHFNNDEETLLRHSFGGKDGK